MWKSTKYLPSTEIWMCNLPTNFTTKATSMSPHGKLGIYMGFQSPSIIKYLEPLMGDLFMHWFADCIFNEGHFLALRGHNKFIDDGQEIV
jgi:hypothetical protein